MAATADADVDGGGDDGPCVDLSDVDFLPSCFISSSLPTRSAFEASLRLPDDERAACEREAALRQRKAAAAASAVGLAADSENTGNAAANAKDASATRSPSRPPPVALTFRQLPPSLTESASSQQQPQQQGQRSADAATDNSTSSTLEEGGAPPFSYASGGAIALRAPPGASATSSAAHLAEARRLLEQLHTLTLRSPAESKNVAMLELAAELTRRLGGGRLTMCKSGKDRTAMSVTLEHGRLLHRRHGLPESLLAETVQIMRRRGVRRENVRLNTSRRLYAFNWLQQMALPEAYRPPAGSAKGGKG